MALYQFKNDKKCLVIFNHFKNYIHVLNVCKQTNIFERVIVIKTNNLSIIEKWDRGYHTFFLYRSLAKLCDDFTFEKLLFFVIDPLTVSFVIKKVFADNSNCELCLADDGLGSYLSYSIYQPKEIVHFLLNFLGRRKYYDKIAYMYLLHPELLTYRPVQTVRNILKTGFDTPEFKEIIIQMFGSKRIPECDYLLLQQPLAQEKGDLKTISDSQERLFQVLDSKVKGKRAYIKLHPRTKYFIQLENCVKLEQNSPFETMIDENINGSTIVTVFSTAAFTPYMLFGFTPRIILLYRLCDNFVFADDMNRFLKVFVKKYEEENAEICIPETIEEFEKLLEV